MERKEEPSACSGCGLVVAGGTLATSLQDAMACYPSLVIMGAGCQTDTNTSRQGLTVDGAYVSRETSAFVPEGTSRDKRGRGVFEDWHQARLLCSDRAFVCENGKGFIHR